MYFDPQTNKFPYLEDTNTHYLPVKKNRGIVFDKNYPYVDTSKSFQFKRKLFRIPVSTVAFLAMRIRLGLKIEGKKNLKKNKALLKQGAVSIANHIHMWDYLAVMRAISPVKPYHLSWDKNVNGENGTIIRLNGGVPVPIGNYAATEAYIKQVSKMLEEGGWLHIYPEGSMWEYYAKIRPFLPGAFYFAYRCNKPIVPMAFSYRKPGFIRSKIFKQIAKLTLHIGEPIMPNLELGKHEGILDLAKRSHEAVVKLAGVEDNLYEPIYNNSKRIDYYTTEYGVGYKGSH